MIDSKEVVRIFEENFKKMSYDEREAYLKKMGFSFGTPERHTSSFYFAKSVRPNIRVNVKAAHVALAGYTTKRKKNETNTVRKRVCATKSKV